MTTCSRRVPARLAVLVALLSSASAVGHADEGFWLFNRVPKAAIKQALGVDLSDSWLKHLQLASVRFPGGSGAFVSPDGLVLTNHHVALDTLQKLSTAKLDLVKHGFLAKDKAQEMRAPDLELLRLERMSDVTAKVNVAVTDRMSPAETLAARRAASAAIEKDSEAASGLQSEVVTLYQGGLYHLYEYKKFTDVRLVFAPEFDAAFYGGDPDNFTFPRYCLDMAIFRVYDGGKPLDVKEFLPWSSTGTTAGEPVFTSGHPGQTQRLNTVAHLEFLRDFSLPLNLDAYGRMRNALAKYGEQGGEQLRQANDLYFSLENSLKSWRGQLEGLKGPEIMPSKTTAEAALRASVAAKPDLQTRYGNAWTTVETARHALPAYNLERVLFEGGLAVFSDYFGYARTLVRWSAESAKPNGERLPEYTDARKPQIAKQLASDAPIYPGVEKARLTAALEFAVDKLGDARPLLAQILDGKSPQERATELAGATKLGDAATRMALFTGGAAAVAASTDPFIRLARVMEPRARDLRTKYDNEVLGAERDAYAKIAQAVFALKGDAAYPDGTFTLRLSYGQVKGYDENGQTVAPFTELRGLYVRGDQHGLKPPYKYPDSWAKARGTLNLTTPYDFVTTNDIVGGNSGSPIVNVKGELVGLVFDGNLQSLPGYFYYDGKVNRTVAVDVRGMTEALRKVYQAEALVAELMAAAATTAR